MLGQLMKLSVFPQILNSVDLSYSLEDNKKTKTIFSRFIWKYIPLLILVTVSRKKNFFGAKKIKIRFNFQFEECLNER